MTFFVALAAVAFALETVDPNQAHGAIFAVLGVLAWTVFVEAWAWRMWPSFRQWQIWRWRGVEPDPNAYAQTWHLTDQIELTEIHEPVTA